MVDNLGSLRYSSEVLHFQRFVGKVRGFRVVRMVAVIRPTIVPGATQELLVRPPVMKPSLAARRDVRCTWETWR